MGNTPTIYDPIPPGKKLIFRPWVTDPATGKRRYASSYNKKVFAILVDDDDVM